MNTLLKYIVSTFKQFLSGLLQGLGFYVGCTLLVNHNKGLCKHWINALNCKENHTSNHNGADENKSIIDKVEPDDNTCATASSRSTSIGNESDLGSIPIVAEEKSVEILVHNVSHGDMIMSIGGSDILPEDSSPESTKFVLCQPRFSAFDLFSRRILNSAFQGPMPDIISFPRYERKETPRYSLVTPRPSRQANLPIGFHFSTDDNVSLLHQELPWLRIRGRDSHRVRGLDERMKEYQSEKLENRSPPQNDEAPDKNDGLYINAIFFPLLSTLLAKWEQQYLMQEKKNMKKVLILVSGVGTPRNYTHSLTGNSTRFCAHLMEKFIKVLYPNVTVVRIHSDESNIFRYDENLSFVKRQLIPCIDAYRDAYARGLPYPDEITDSIKLKGNDFNTEWKNSFHVTLSFADGSPARTYAIQASLRPYRPTYFHVWQLKTFWHNIKVCDDDIEIHSYEEMEITPATDVSIANEKVQSIVEEIKRFKHEFLMRMTQRNDLARFWLRKTKKPVLAVLLVEKSNGFVKLYRGTNMEVSMPTGSLCAERNVIGTALAADPSLRREELKMVAVLAVHFTDGPSNTTFSTKQIDNDSNKLISQLCIKCEDGKTPSNEIASSDINSVSSSPHSPVPMLKIPKSTSISSFTNFVLEDKTGKGGEDNLSHVSEPQGFSEEPSDNDLSNAFTPNHETTNGVSSAAVLRRINLYADTDSENYYCKLVNDSDQIKGTFRNDKLKKIKRTVVVHSCEDINPLRPCGACNEWLKKIAESNPYFKVLTFTDADCNGVYISSCQD